MVLPVAERFHAPSARALLMALKPELGSVNLTPSDFSTFPEPMLTETQAVLNAMSVSGTMVDRMACEIRMKRSTAQFTLSLLMVAPDAYLSESLVGFSAG